MGLVRMAELDTEGTRLLDYLTSPESTLHVRAGAAKAFSPSSGGGEADPPQMLRALHAAGLVYRYRERLTPRSAAAYASVPEYAASGEEIVWWGRTPRARDHLLLSRGYRGDRRVGVQPGEVEDGVLAAELGDAMP